MPTKKREIAKQAAQAADVAVEAYQEYMGIRIPEIALRDLLADLHHWADANEVDFEDALEQSRNYTVEER